MHTWLEVAATLAVLAVVGWLWKQRRAEAAVDAAFRRKQALIKAREALSHSLPKRGYTKDELRQYDGRGEERPIRLAADGKVFNVTTGYDFYGEGGCYNVLAGRDSSRMLAKGILLEESVEEAAKPLGGEELSTLQDWVMHYESKYVLLGPLLPDTEDDWRMVDEATPAATQPKVAQQPAAARGAAEAKTERAAVAAAAEKQAAQRDAETEEAAAAEATAEAAEAPPADAEAQLLASLRAQPPEPSGTIAARLRLRLGSAEPRAADATTRAWTVSCDAQGNSVVRHENANADAARLVMRCVLEASPDERKPRMFMLRAINERAELLREFLHVGEDPEQVMLRCSGLNEVQAYCAGKGWPKNLMKDLFYQLYESDVILEEAYLAWQEDTRHDDGPDKRKALFQVDVFLQWLRTTEDQGQVF